MKRSLLFSSPVGPLTLISNGKALTHVLLPNQSVQDDVQPNEDDVLRQARQNLSEWFAGTTSVLKIPIAFEQGTSFQRAVWQELLCIPVGATISYTELARRVGRPQAVRAVGTANGRNPLPVIVPCHRVIAADGSLAGYAGGTDIKRALLEHEQTLTAVPCGSR